MSYAAMAAKGPKQTAEEVGRSILNFRAPALPQVEHTEDSVSSLVDVDSPHVSSVPSDFGSQEIKTTTQSERLDLEQDDKNTAKAKAEADKKSAEAKQKAEEKAEQAKQKAKRAAELADKNKGNPVIVGNTIATVAIAAALGIGAYRKYSAGELTWKVAGIWAGAVGLFAAADVYLSKFLFQKYPPKK